MYRRFLPVITFLAVFAAIVIPSLVVTPIIIDRVEREYLNLQSDINRRQAEAYGRFVEAGLRDGMPPEEILKILNRMLEGADADRGFSCVVSQTTGNFVSHPIRANVGMPVSSKRLEFEAWDRDIERDRWERIIGLGRSLGGLLISPENDQEVVYMQAIPEAGWTIATHENTSRSLFMISGAMRSTSPAAWNQAEIADRDDISCPEQRIKLIRERLYNNYYSSHDPVRKYRWFFYIPEVKSLWIDKKGKLEQEVCSIQMEIQEEETAYLLEDDEGNRIETNGMRLQRSAVLVKAVKERDNFTCRACGFSYRNKIVHVHHLDPLAERKRRTTKKDDLVTLCPNCHYLAHHFLRDKKLGHTFKSLAILLAKLEKAKQ